MSAVMVDASGTAGVAATVALAADTGRVQVYFQNLHATQTIGYTLNGSTPVIGAAGTFTLAAAGGRVTFDSLAAAQSQLKVIGSGASTPYTINWS